MIPKIIKNVAETDVPMIPPTLEKASNLAETAAAVAATVIDVITTILLSQETLVPQKGATGKNNS